MKCKAKISTMLLLGALFMTSCGNKSESKFDMDVAVLDLDFVNNYAPFSTVNNYLNLNEFFEVSPIQTTLNNKDLHIDIQLKRNDNDMNVNTAILKYSKVDNINDCKLKKNRYTFYMELYDNQYKILNSEINIQNAEKLFSDSLLILKSVVSLNKMNDTQLNLIKENGACIKLYGLLNADKYESRNGGRGVSSTSSGNSINDWDEWLDEYEKCVDRLIVYIEKIQTGDTNIIKEYTDLLESTSNMYTKLSNERSSMNQQQIARLLQIYKKMSVELQNQ